MSDIVSQFMEITGLSENVAETILNLNDNNLELAINYHLENGAPNGIDCNPDILNDMPSDALSNSNGTNNSDYIAQSQIKKNSDPDLMDIRPPIPSKREQLLQPDEDPFRFLGSQDFLVPTSQFDSRRKRRIPFTVCPFRDFSREAELQEEELIEMSTAKNSSETFHATRMETVNSSFTFNSLQMRRTISKTNREHNMKSRFNARQTACDSPQPAAASSPDIIRKHRRLDDLFRPPTDLLFCGTFQGARDHAKSQNRWMLVNLQDQCEFKSQILNRDIWPDPKLRELIKSYFVLWQISVENREGIRFKIFYHCENIPYVCIIDPRTGEEKLKCGTNSLNEFYSELMRFLSDNSYNLDATVPEKRRRTTTSTSTSNSTSTYLPKEAKSDLELSEQDQIELAILKSLNETNDNTTKKSNWNAADYPDNDINKNLENNELGTTSSSMIKFDENSEMKIPKNKDYTSATSQNSKTENMEESKTGKNVNISDSLKVLNFSSSSYLDYLGSRHDPLTQIQIRVSDQHRETIKWPASTRLAALKLFIVEKLMPSKLSCEATSALTIDSVKLIRSFPRQNIFELNQNLTLLEANLHPSSILYLHLDD